MRPDYINEHIKSFIALGPIISVANPSGTITAVMDKSHIFDILYALHLKNVWTTHALLPIQIWLGKLMPNFIEDEIVANIVGPTEVRHFDVIRMPCMVANEPGGTSA